RRAAPRAVVFADDGWAQEGRRRSEPEGPRRPRGARRGCLREAGRGGEGAAVGRVASAADLATLQARLETVASLDAAALDALEIAVLGRKQGELTAALKALATLPIEERKAAGAALNALKLRFESAIAERREALVSESRRASRAALDLTMPGRAAWTGTRHPVSDVID